MTLNTITCSTDGEAGTLGIALHVVVVATFLTATIVIPLTASKTRHMGTTEGSGVPLLTVANY